MSFKKILIFSLVFCFIASLLLPFIEVVDAVDTSEAVEKREAQLKAELEVLLGEIAEKQALLNGKKGESASLQRDIAILNAKIDTAQLNIKKSDILLEQLRRDIGVKSQTLTLLEQKLERGKESLADLFRKADQISQISLVEVVLNTESLSEAFADLDSYDVLTRSLHDLSLQIVEQKGLTETQRKALEEKSKDEADARAIKEAEKRKVVNNQVEKKDLLAVTKSQEKNYQIALAQRQKKAAGIRAALFALRDTAAIPFGTALEYANFAQQKTGVRPAFLLAILTQETNLGANIGTCNRPGDPISKGWRAIMPGPADIAAGQSKRNDEGAFLAITAELGLDPNVMPLSCPWQVGWGGAMGPAQFIPTTWQAFKGRVASLLGKSVANPWEPKDAFMASSIYLGDLGASKGGYSAEREAALRYYAGGNWWKPTNAFYGNQVLAKATTIQETMIDPLQNL